MDRSEQEEYIDVFFGMWKEQMLKMTDTVPVVMLYATMKPVGGDFGIFINSTFQNVYMTLLEGWLRGDLPLETDLFPPDELCQFKIDQGRISGPHLCSHTRLEHGGDDAGACQVADCECEEWTLAPILTKEDFEDDN